MPRGSAGEPPARDPDPAGPSARAPGKSETGARARPDDLVRELIEQTPGVSPGERPEPQPEARGPIEGPARLLFLDLDGTLTDGVITYDQQGDARHFFIRDGLALRWADDLGLKPVVISGRESRAGVLRLEDLGLEHHFGVADKVAVAQSVIERERAAWERCAMVGDDLPDLPLMKRVGWPIAVADAVPEIRAVARTVTAAPGGRGAVREVVELLLRHNGVWDQVLAKYGAS
jgi:3-deoxy-D-manno-octulosonate 8-phosphate phosphatase (KDO 8-P phosphatase)